ncbi:MAG: hypothetical protein HY505_00855 [Candidatus Yanofskybacteria bacterium]|nr:hypothetical protein [Candidatus Yanofskybacteria bacterium]
MKPQKLYHGSSSEIKGSLQPVLKQDSPDHIHTRASVFATERIDIASLFMFPFKENIASIGFEEGTAFICVWGTPEEFKVKNRGGYLYTLPVDTFEKVGKEYEWQSFESINPLEVKKYDSVIDGILSCGAKVYFINDEKIMDKIRDNVGHRMPILQGLKPYQS